MRMTPGHWIAAAALGSAWLAVGLIVRANRRASRTLANLIGPTDAG